MAAILRPTGTIQLAPWKCLNLFFNDNIYEKDVYQKQASCACDDSAFFSTFDLFGKMFHFAGLWCPNHLTHTNSWGIMGHWCCDLWTNSKFTHNLSKIRKLHIQCHTGSWASNAYCCHVSVTFTFYAFSRIFPTLFILRTFSSPTSSSLCTMFGTYTYTPSIPCLPPCSFHMKRKEWL